MAESVTPEEEGAGTQEGREEEIVYKRLDTSNAHEGVSCDFCEKADAKAEWRCKICPMNLCQQCKSEHLGKKIWASHKIDRIGFSKNSPEKCSNHPMEAVSLYCRTCDTPVCNECITTIHNEHTFLDYSEALDLKKKELARFHTCIKDETARTEDAMKQLEVKSADLHRKANEMREKIEKQKEAAISMADEICDEMEDNVKKFETKYEEDMEAFSTTVGDLGKKITSVIGQCDEMKNKELHEICQFLHENSELSTTSLPGIPVLVPPVFLKGKVRNAELHRQFGTLVSTDKLYEVTTAQVPQCLVFDDLHTIWTCNKNYTGIQNFRISDTSLSQESEITTDFEVGSLAYFKGRDSVLLVFDQDRRKVFKLNKSGKIEKFRDLDEIAPKGLLMNKYGEIIVYSMHLITIYSPDAKTKRQKIKNDQDGINLFQDIQFITQNHNGDYVLIDNIGKSDNIRKFVILAIDNAGVRKRWLYGTDTELAASALACDKQKNVLVSDYAKSEVFVLSQDGEYLLKLLTAQHGIWKPSALGIDSSRRLWVGQGNGQKGRLTVFKYMYLTS